MSESAAAVQRVVRKLRLLSHLHPLSVTAIEMILDDAIRHHTKCRDSNLLLRLRIPREAREGRRAH